MTFLWPAMLWLMVLVPVTVFVLRLAMQRRSRTASSFADAPLLDTVLTQAPVAHERWPLGLQLVALSCLLFAASRPIALRLCPRTRPP
jgi:Ca-activated chloride channel homolog